MKSFIFAVSALVGSSIVGAQSLPPSPTASTGCEPHGDHWHCDAPVSVTPTPTASTATPTPTESDDHDHDHDHDHEDGEDEELPPSPTASYGCHSHGDHWHCDGPRETGSASPSPTAPPEGAAISLALPTAAIVGGIMAAVGMGI